MRAPFISGGSWAIGFRLTLQWSSRKSDYPLGAAILCISILGSGVFQPCRSSTMYHYTGNPLVATFCSPLASAADCAPGIITVAFTANSDNTTINTYDCALLKPPAPL